jgi:hypothetical protein
MEASNGFKQIIEQYLQQRAQQDPLFAETLKKPNKNITDCITYILNEVKKSGQQGFADEEIFNMAVHYYDEDNLEIGKPLNCAVKVNHHMDAPAPAAVTPTIHKKKSTPAPINQPSLF